MSDGAFRAVLNQEAWVCRPSTRLAGDLTLATPTYETLGQPRPVRVMPVSAGTQATVIGKTPGATGIVYMEPGDIRAGDRVEVIKRTIRLAAEARAGSAVVTVEDASGVAVGARLHLHDGAETESVTVAAIANGELTVTPALRCPHAAGENSWITEAHEVEGVCDEAGQGHHLKVLVRAVTGS